MHRYKGDKSQLSDLDQFLMALIEIPNLNAKLNLQLWIHEFPLQFDELQPAIALALKATDEILTSKRLEQVLLYGLSVGNHVNGGTAKGGKHGVSLKSFPKFSDSKGGDKKTTLMDFLYYTLKKKKRQAGQDLTKVLDDIEHTRKATETSVKALSAEVRLHPRFLCHNDILAHRMSRLNVVH